jgi:hypothetical protein
MFLPGTTTTEGRGRTTTAGGGATTAGGPIMTVSGRGSMYVPSGVTWATHPMTSTTTTASRTFFMTHLGFFKILPQKRTRANETASPEATSYICAGLHSNGFSGAFCLTCSVRRPGRPGDSLRRVPRDYRMYGRECENAVPAQALFFRLCIVVSDRIIGHNLIEFA